MSKKKTIAKGLGASALALATIASGLSFGASAATAATPAESTPTESAPFQLVSKLADNKYFSLDMRSSRPGDAHAYGTYHTTRAAAEKVAETLTAESAGDGSFLIRSVDEPELCLAGFWGLGAYHATAASCDASGKDFLWRLDGAGQLTNAHRNDWGRPIWLSDSVSDAGWIRMFETPTRPNWVDLPDNLGEAFEALTATGSFPDDATRRAVVSGSAEPGATITVKNGATVVATVMADSSGDYSIGVPAPNKGGVLNLTVTQTIDGQNGGSQNVALDYGRAVEVQSPSDQDEVSGATAITGVGEPGASVQVFDNAGRTPIVSATVRDNGAWSGAANLSRGEHVLEAKQMSKGANTTTSTVTVNPGDEAVELSAAGRFDDEDATKPATAFGSAPTGETVILRNAAGTEIGRTVAVDNAYEITIDPKNARAGVNTFSAVIAGDTSNAKSFTLDYGQAGTGVVVTTPAKNGNVAEGVVEFRGSGQAGAKVVVRGSAREVARGTVNAQGAWTASTSMALGKGSYDLYFDQVTKGGLTNTVRHAFTVGTVTPPIAQQTVTSPTAGETVETLRPTFEGTGQNGATITVRGSSRVLGTGTVANGRWTVQTGMDLAPGTYNLYVDQTVGGTLTGTVRVEFTVSASAFRELTLTSPAANEAVTTLRPTFVGTATPGAEIRIGSSRTVVATATVGQDGTFRTTASIDLARGGSYNLEVKQTTKSGKTSTVQAPFTIDRTAQ